MASADGDDGKSRRKSLGTRMASTFRKSLRRSSGHSSDTTPNDEGMTDQDMKSIITGEVDDEGSLVRSDSTLTSVSERCDLLIRACIDQLCRLVARIHLKNAWGLQSSKRGKNKPMVTLHIGKVRPSDGCRPCSYITARRITRSQRL